MDTLAPASATLSQRMADYICSERLVNIDDAARAKVKHVIAYHAALAFRALAAKDPEAKRAIDVAKALSEGGGSYALIGSGDKLTLLDAAFANCQLMRSFGLDDVIFETGVHPGLVTLPVAFALAQRQRTSGAELITAIVVGYEMLGKFARWSWSLESPRRATMPFGPFGSVATASRMLGFDRDRTAVALAYAAHSAMGLAENDMGPISHFYGLVCRNGLTGALLSEAGAWGSPTVLEGRFGFIEAFLGEAALDQNAMLASLGHNHAIMQSCEKRYPGTGLNQVPIELMRAIVHEEGVRAHRVERIDIDLPKERENFAAGHATGPFQPAIAPSSAAYQCAMMLLDGDLDFSRYAQTDNRDILDVIDRTHFHFVDGKPIRYARIVLQCKDGRRIERSGDSFFFEPETPRTLIERHGAQILPDAQINRFLDLLENLEDVEDASTLVESLAL
ncbi:MmgE/PrpD family protein [Terricaulis sp.]|uniref:MmgE/PrpD family protein n=1 Tax=Terricaulis sp. TaxID=2768686 RepID=UPI003784AF08